MHRSKKLKLIHVKTKAVYKMYKGAEHYTKQCSLKDMYIIVTYNLSFDLSLVYAFNTVDVQQTAIL